MQAAALRRRDATMQTSPYVRLRHALTVSTALAGLALPGAAFAQEEPDGRNSEDSIKDRIAEILKVKREDLDTAINYINVVSKMIISYQQDDAHGSTVGDYGRYRISNIIFCTFFKIN